jgi:L-lactate dehydrogenase (cytochrome)
MNSRLEAADFSGFQNAIYAGGEPPPFPIDWRQLEAAAYASLSPAAVGYVAGGAGGEETMRANREAFDRWRILPRMLHDVASRDLTTTLLRTPMPAPVLLGPVAVQKIIHNDGELATARAAAGLGLVYVHSTAATASIEDAAQACGEGPRWFQLYFPNDRELAVSFVARAEASGYSAVVVTLDGRFMGWRPRDLTSAYLPFLHGLGIENYTSDPVFRRRLPDDAPETAIAKWVQTFPNPGLGWDDIAWLREQTRLPMLVKGICAADDARRALDVGVDGVVVSNHGGRQVDGAVGALDVLPDVVDAIGTSVPVLFDSGIRTGADALKALALGASAVLLARPVMWGLALGGQHGVHHVLAAFLCELDNTLAMAGYRSHRELSRRSLAARP